MNTELQFWATIAQIVSLPIAVLALILQLLIYLVPKPTALLPIIGRVRTILPYIAVAGIGVWLGTRTTTPNAELLTDLQATNTSLQATVIAVQLQTSTIESERDVGSTDIPNAIPVTQATVTPTDVLEATNIVADNLQNTSATTKSTAVPITSTQVGQYSLTLRSCTRATSAIVCEVLITNQERKSRNLYIGLDGVRIVVPDGNSYLADGVVVGGRKVNTAVGAPMPYDVPILSTVTFEDIPAEVVELVLLEYDVALVGKAELRNIPVLQADS